MLRLVGAVLLLGGLPSAVLAQQVCAERKALLDSLAHDFSEAPSAVGVANNGAVIEVLTARDGKTWTILLTMPSGRSCVMAAGENWTDVPQQVAGSDA